MARLTSLIKDLRLFLEEHEGKEFSKADWTRLSEMFEDLVAAFRERTARRVKTNLLDVKEASKLLGMSGSELRRRVRWTEEGKYDLKPHKRIPYISVGKGRRKSYLFEQGELEVWKTRNRRRPKVNRT